MKTLVREYPEIRRDYPGGLPEKLEQEMVSLLNVNTEEILHIFGGLARIGLRGDININVKPDYVGDAHNLPFRDNSYRVVFCDPPYSDGENYLLYGNKMSLFYDKWINEACRVSSKYIVTRHIKLLPCPKKWDEVIRVFFTLCPNRYIHLAQIFKYD